MSNRDENEKGEVEGGRSILSPRHGAFQRRVGTLSHPRASRRPFPLQPWNSFTAQETRTDGNIRVYRRQAHHTTQMDDIVSSPPETNLRKRPASEIEHHDSDSKPLNLKGNQFIMPTPPDTEESSNASPEACNNNDDMDRAASPAPSSVLSSAIDVASSNAHTVASSSATAMPSSFLATAPNSTSAPPPAKRRKLTPSEKLEASRAKEAKAREKAELKAQKEEEKARKEEKKARKDEEKAKLQVLKDEDKRVKDEEKRQKAEERVRLRRHAGLGALPTNIAKSCCEQGTCSHPAI